MILSEAMSAAEIEQYQLLKMQQFQEIQEELIVQLEFPECKPELPFLLLIGGLIGTGKTTVLSLLKQDPSLGLAIVSNDVVRQRAKEKGYHHYASLQEESRLVNSVSEQLAHTYLYDGYSLALDSNAAPDKIFRMRRLLQDNQHPQTLVAIHLTAPVDILEQRILERSVIPGRHMGTIDELHKAIALFHNIDLSPYDAIIDTDREPSQRVADIIKEIALQKALGSKNILR